MKLAVLLLSHENKFGTLQNVHMPLSIGVIGEFLRLNFSKEPLQIELFKRPSKFDKYLEKNSPDVVMFGNYLWNENLNLFYAQTVKKISAKTLIVMGGPNISINLKNKENFLLENTSIDVLVEGDGELVSLELLNKYHDVNKCIASLKYAKTMNCFSYDHEKHEFLIGILENTRLGIGEMSLDETPSPYLSGLMDVFFEDNAIPLLESNRGCPYSCSFCQQGTKYFSKIRFFDGGRIHDEMLYIAKRREELGVHIVIVEFADPNFGQYSQDLDTFKGIKNTQDLFDFPSQVWCSTGKSQAKRIMAHAKMLKPGSIMIRAAMQSMNPETLSEVERKNLPKDVFENFSKDGVETYSDVMLGLPMETFETYVSGVLQLIDSNIDEFSMPQTLLLKGTPMEATHYLEKFDIRTRPRAIPECKGSYGKNSIKVTDFEQMIMHTSTMNFEHYLECRKFALIIMIFHNTRLLKHVYRFFDHVEIKRSVLIREIFNASLVSESFAPVFKEFLNLTQKELLEEPSLPEGTDLDELTSNKVFKFLSVALMGHKCALIELVSTALNNPSVNLDETETLFFIKMFKDTLIRDLTKDTIRDLTKDTEKIKRNLPPLISSAFGAKTYECFLTEFQLDRIDSLGKLYPKKKDRENKLPYHLRAINMVKTIRFA